MQHFNSFTSEAMRAFGQELAAAHQQRLELIETTRSQTHTLLANARRQRHEEEARRCQQAAQEADARRLFTSELRSGVHALRNRFELARRDMAADFQNMAGESRATRQEFRNRPGRKVETAARRPHRPAAQAGNEGNESVKPRAAHNAKSDHFKKRPGQAESR